MKYSLSLILILFCFTFTQAQSYSIAAEKIIQNISGQWISTNPPLGQVIAPTFTIKTINLDSIFLTDSTLHHALQKEPLWLERNYPMLTGTIDLKDSQSKFILLISQKGPLLLNLRQGAYDFFKIDTKVGLTDNEDVLFLQTVNSNQKHTFIAKALDVR